jgi:hypothetical protein
MVEPVNGQIKEPRGLRGYPLRGLGMVDGESPLIAANHNLLRLLRCTRSRQQVLVRATGSGSLAIHRCGGPDPAARGSAQGLGARRRSMVACWAEVRGCWGWSWGTRQLSFSLIGAAAVEAPPEVTDGLR